MSIKNFNVLKNQLNIYLIPSLVYYPDGCTIFVSSYLIYLCKSVHFGVSDHKVIYIILKSVDTFWSNENKRKMSNS